MKPDEYKQIVSMFSENAKTYTQVSIAALLLPITFIRQVLGVPPNVSIATSLWWPLYSSWALLLVAIAAGLLYQYIAVKLVEARFANSEELYGMLKCFIKRPDKIYAIMMLAFYLGAFFFVVGVVRRF
jgi:hypothetical protein